MRAVFWLIDTILSLVVALIVIKVIMSWLISFEVIPAYHQIVSRIMDFLYQMTEPLLERVRRVIPMFGGIDFTPLIVIVLITFFQILLHDNIAPLFGVNYF